MARNKWSDNIVDWPHRHTISLGLGLIKVRIHKVDADWVRKRNDIISDDEIKELCRCFKVYINRVRIPELDGENIEEIKKNCMAYIGVRLGNAMSCFPHCYQCQIHRSCKSAFYYLNNGESVAVKCNEFKILPAYKHKNVIVKD